MWLAVDYVQLSREVRARLGILDDVIQQKLAPDPFVPALQG